MSFRFTIDSQVYDLVTSSQSGAIVNQWRVLLRSSHEITRFVDNLLEQNHHQADELQRFLAVTDQSPKEALIDQIQKGQLVVQKGYVAHPGGSARAPGGVSRHKKKGPKSRFYSDAMLNQMADVDNNGNTTGNASGGSQAKSRQWSSSDSQGASQPASTSRNERQYKICIEIAGRARCYKQQLEISAINGGKQPGERKRTERVRLDHKVTHRSLVAFDGLPNAPRDLALVITTTGAASDICLPLVNGHPASDKSTDKPEWDTVLIPVRPLAYINKERKRQQADLLQPGYVYVFWNNKLWRELQANRNQALRDINVEFYRKNWNGDIEQAVTREAEGHWLSEVWVPYKLNGDDQSGRLQLLYSETQLDMPYIETLENDSAKLQEKSTSLQSLNQYSDQQHFDSNDGDVGAIKTALLDQAIDPDVGYQVISDKGKRLNTARQQNIPVAYLVPAGEKFVLQVEDDNGPCRNKKFSLKTSQGHIEGQTDYNGVLEIQLQERFSEGEVALWLDDNSEQPSQIVPFRSEPQKLSDVSTVEGQQLRLNNLGFNAGVVDGINGRKTKSAAKGFQSHHKLAVDGIIGPKTQKKLKQSYGQ